MQPVGMTSMSRISRSPMRMTAPLPNCFSMPASATASAFFFSSVSVTGATEGFCFFSAAILCSFLFLSDRDQSTSTARFFQTYSHME